MNGVEVANRPDSPRRIMRKVVVSCVIGGVSYAITELTGQPQIWSITLSVFLGGVTLVVQFLIEFEIRLGRVEIAENRHSERMELLVTDGFARVNEATELFRLMERSPLPTETVTELVRHSTLITPNVPALVSGFAHAEIARVSSLLKELSDSGSMVYDGEDRDWLLTLTREAATAIDATSLTTVDAGREGYTLGGLWTSDLGQRYLDLQREAIQRGVKVRRIFIALHQDDPGFASVCRQQQEIGIDVRVLDSASIPDRLRDWLFDFILFDDAISYEVTPSSRVEDTGRPTIVNTRLELHRDRIRNRVRRFQDLWESAKAP